ncbi:MAG: DinB family protein [Treponema sp.]|jgi:uncharacterized damage-inducible protein DinB|nr:DinB family protein [Treponema sp.]
MNDLVMYAKYNQAANKTIYDILDKLSNEDREKERGAYFKSLSGTLRHIYGGTWFFLGLFKAAANSGVPAIEGERAPEGSLSAEQWKALGAQIETIDAAFVDFTRTLKSADLALPVKWFSGDPAEVSLSFMIHQLNAHNIHHRGQISQILDELKIDNDYSTIAPAFA